MSYYRFFQTGEEGVWHPIQDGPNVLQQAKENGAKKLTLLAVDKAIDSTDSRGGHKYKGPLYFDIDGDDLNEAIISARQLVKRLIEFYEVSEEAIFPYLSGGKGVHILVDQRAFMQRRTAVKDLPLIYKEMATELYVPGLDLAPYSLGKNNTFRIENLKRHDGNYRVPIRVSELMSMDPSQYKVWVSKPRHELAFPEYEGNFSLKMANLYAQSSQRCVINQKELQERGRKLMQKDLVKVADQAPPCVEQLMSQRGLTQDASFNAQALNIGLWAARAGVPEVERDRVFAVLADNAEPSARYPNARARRTELEGKYRYAQSNPDYHFGCGAMRSLVKQGGKICENCPLEKTDGKSSVEFLSDMAERLGLAQREHGYQKVHTAGGITKLEPISTFTLKVEAVYREEQADGTGSRRTGALCSVLRNGETLGRLVMDESSWSSKSSFVKALEGISGVYYTGSDADVQKIKMLVFLEEEEMPEIHQVGAGGIFIEEQQGHEVVTYVEPGKSLNSLHMMDTHRLAAKGMLMAPKLFQQKPLKKGCTGTDQTLANLCRINQPEVMAMIIGYHAACHLKAHLRDLYGQFPMLSLWGGAGSGKSKTAELVGSLNGLDFNKQSKANCTVINRFNLIEMLSSSTTVPRLLEEFNKDKMPDTQYTMLGEMFKMLFNAESASRGTVVSGKGAMSTMIPLTAPVVVLSEQAIKMPALRERSLIIKLRKTGRNAEAFKVATAGRVYLMQIGQALMMRTLQLQTKEVARMFEEASSSVMDGLWDDRPTYGLRVVHLGLAWLAEICREARLEESVRQLELLRSQLTQVTRPAAAAQAQEEDSLTKLLGQGSYRERTEVDVFMQHLYSMIVDSASTLQESTKTQKPPQRRVWVSPRNEFQISGDTLYLWPRTCHARFVEWCRAGGIKTPLAEYSDFRQLVEDERYFEGWRTLPDFAFGEEALALSLPVLEATGFQTPTLRVIYDTLGPISLEF